MSIDLQLVFEDEAAVIGHLQLEIWDGKNICSQVIEGCEEKQGR